MIPTKMMITMIAANPPPKACGEIGGWDSSEAGLDKTNGVGEAVGSVDGVGCSVVSAAGSVVGAAGG